MPITSDELKLYRSLYVNDAVTNGGRIGTTQMTSGAMNNLFRNVPSSELLSGIELYRKFFIKNDNAVDIRLENPKIWIGNISSGEDYFTIAEGTDTDNQGVADDYPDWYGCGILDHNINSGETSIDVQFKQGYGLPEGCGLIFYDGVNRAEAYMSGSPTWNGSLATITLLEGITYSYLKDETIVSGVLELNTLQTSLTNWVESSGEGVFDETSFPLVLYNIGTISESWTITFQDSTNFEVTGAVIGSLGLGSINVNFMPINGQSYYFKLNKSGWSGTWLAGDTITFKTVHAAQGIWVKEDVPAGCNSQSNNMFELKFKGESA